MIRFRLLVLLVALLFSTAALHQAGRLHPDEAFYLTFARNAAVRGDWWMVSEPVDKPPLTFYSNALAMVLFAVKLDANGVHQLDPLQGEFAGRMSAFLLSIVLVALVIRLAYTLLQHRDAALLAGVLVALSPMRIAFAATAFTDLPMLTFATGGLWMAAKGRWMLAGCWMALAFAAKPQVIFLFPLLLLGWRHWRKAWRFLPPMILCVLMLALWDQTRMQQGAESFWSLGQQRYPAISMLPLPDWNARLLEIWASLGYLFGSPILTGIISSAALIAGAFHEKTRLLAVWIAGFIVIHSISSLNIYDRNLIVLLPPLAVLAGWMLIHSRVRKFYTAYWLVALMIAGGWQAAAGNLPIGGDDGRHDGIDQLAIALNSKPVATVIYDRWLDWELDYYMGVWTDKRRVYYHTASELVTGALALPETGIRYFVAPMTVQVDAWITALQSAGFEVWLDQEIAAFRIYGLRPP